MNIKVLVVEDEVLVAEDIAADLETYGFQITDIAISSEECFASLSKNTPDVVLMDINIKGETDGINTAEKINTQYNIPIIYLTANTDSSTMKRALESAPSAFISKPYNNKDLSAALEIAFNKHNGQLLRKNETAKSDSFFVKNGDYFTRIKVEDINYIEADGSYSKIHTDQKNYVLTSNLNHFQEHNLNPNLVRIHRSYIANLNKVEAFDKNTVVINSKVIPVSKSYQKELTKWFNKL